MIFEHRTYSLAPGTTAAFMKAQTDRGFESIRPIAERLIGYFVDPRDSGDRIVHLYRYNDFEDWQQRLHGLYGVIELEPYFKTVRSMMMRQDNFFMSPAAFGALTPIWGNGNDWHPGESSPLHNKLSASAVVLEKTFFLKPGKTGLFFQERSAPQACQQSQGQSLGWFISITGRLHRVVRYTLFDTIDVCRGAMNSLSSNFNADLIAEEESRVLFPVMDIPQMSPLLAQAVLNR